MKVLIAERDIVESKKMRRILEELDYDVIGEADNGLKAYNKFVEMLPDVVLVDLKLPLLDGISTLTRILNYKPNAAVVVLSHEDEHKLVFEAIENGALHYIKKPFHNEVVRKTFDEIKSINSRMERKCIK